MNCKQFNHLFMSVVVSGISILSISNFASAQIDPSRIYQRRSTDSENPCEYILSGMDVLGSDFYERLNAYQQCGIQWQNDLRNQRPQSNKKPPRYNSNNNSNKR